MHCTECGQKLDPDSEFCEQCGHGVASNSKSNTSIIWQHKLIVMVLVLGAIIGFGVMYIGSSPENPNTATSTADQSNQQSTTSKIQQQISQLQSSQASTTQRINSLQEKNASLRQQNQQLRQELSRTQSAVQEASQQSSGLSDQLTDQISSHIVRVQCVGDDGVSSGSGIIDADTRSTTNWRVYTNLHVVYSGDNSGGCLIGIPEAPDYQPEAEVEAVFERGADNYPEVDFAILEPDTNNQRMNPFPVPECGVEDIETGDPITVFGYPSIGGQSLTVTSGIVSGRSYTAYGPYYKTSAAIGQGVSGGVAIDNNSECSIGIPTLGVRGDLAGLGYIQAWSTVRDSIDF